MRWPEKVAAQRDVADDAVGIIQLLAAVDGAWEKVRLVVEVHVTPSWRATKFNRTVEVTWFSEPTWQLSRP